MTVETGSGGLLVEHLYWLQRVNQQVKNGLLPEAALASYQTAFVAALGSRLDLSRLAVTIIRPLAIASPADPVSIEQLVGYALRHCCWNSADPTKLRRDVLGEIRLLNTELPERTRLQILMVPSEQHGQERWFLGERPRPKGLLTGRQSEIMNLIAAGYTNDEIAGRIIISPNTVEIHVSKAYRRLGVHGDLEAVLLLMEQGNLDTRFLRERLNICQFAGLNPQHQAILRKLIEDPGTTDRQIAGSLAISPGTVGNHINEIREVLGVQGRRIRVALGAGYWLYQQETAENIAGDPESAR